MARQWPLPEGSFTISSRFAGRTNPITGAAENHSGTDFAIADGTPFYACAGGTVQYIGAADGYGQWIVIDHPTSEGGGCTEYGHMWNAFATGLNVGDWVEAGKLIGYVGNNGESTGPHLHLTVWQYAYGGTRIDPETWLEGCLYPGNSNTTTGGTSVTTTFGVDVSYFQNGMSLATAATQGIDFAIIRTNDGTFRDPQYVSHLLDAESAGLVTAAYAYLRNPSEGSTIAQQVDTMVSVMGDYKRPVWMDCENSAGLSAAHIREFKQRAEAAGVPVIGAYSYVPWWEGKVIGGEPDSHEFGAFWVAAYGTNPAGTPAAIYPGNSAAQWDYPVGNQKPSLWQFGSNASVAGYSVDINAFRGTKDELRALFYGGNATSQEDDMFTDQDREALYDCRAMLMALSAQDMGDANLTGPYGGWRQTGYRTRTDLLAAIAHKLGVPGTTDTKEK